QDERGSLVFVVEGRSVRRREVQTGTDNGLTVEALSGLKEGEKVVVRGKERLVSGMRVKVANR
ncbi:MAG: efflux transporter periplasmic adaptor subunit, partial [Armatimonadetes bacterium CG_4_9_14_3_um_filter_58_7]